VAGLNWGLGIHRPKQSWVNQLHRWQFDRWVQERFINSGTRVGERQGRLQGAVACGRKGIIRKQWVSKGCIKRGET
jgi:hypothetical protein